jgi:hypothetical protein
MEYNAINPHKNGIDNLVVHLYTMNSSNPKKEFWTIDEIFNDLYPNANISEKSKIVPVLRTNLEWIKSKKALEIKNKKSVKPIRFRLSSLIDELYSTT